MHSERHHAAWRWCCIGTAAGLAALATAGGADEVKQHPRQTSTSVVDATMLTLGGATDADDSPLDAGAGPGGVCCLGAPGNCEVLSPDDCDAVGGFFFADITSCDAIACPELPTCASDVCPEDLNGSESVDVSDLLALLAGWGPCGRCPADLTGDGLVDVFDLLSMLAAWGPCPEDDGQMIDEGEPCVTGADDVVNCGCDADSPVFGAVCCGDTVTGTVWADGGARDVDSFLLTIDDVAAQTSISIDLVHNFGAAGLNGELHLARAECPADMIDLDTGASPLSVNEVLEPGTYIVFVRPAGFEGLSCDSGKANHYSVSVDCIPHVFCQDNCGGLYFDPVTGFFCSCEEGCEDWDSCCPGFCDECPECTFCGGPGCDP